MKVNKKYIIIAGAILIVGSTSVSALRVMNEKQIEDKRGLLPTTPLEDDVDLAPSITIMPVGDVIEYQVQDELADMKNNASQFNLTVTNKQLREDGTVFIEAVDEQGGPYTFGLSDDESDTPVALIEVGDELTVYYDVIMESYPMQLAPIFVEGNKQVEVVDDVTNLPHPESSLLALDTSDYVVGEAITIGKIVDFDGPYIHIMSGSAIGVYEYDNTAENNFYSGQFVKLIKGEKANTLEPLQDKVYDDHLWVKGTRLTPYTGEVISLEDGVMTLQTEDGEKSFNYYDNVNEWLIGSRITAYVGQLGEYESMVYMVDEEAKLEVEVVSTSRDGAGSMWATVCQEEALYTVNVSSSMLDFDIASLQAGDELTIYHKRILRTEPAQIIPVLIERK